MEGYNVVMSFNVKPQNLKAEDEKFPLSFHVFKVRQPTSGLPLSGHLREQLARLGEFTEPQPWR